MFALVVVEARNSAVAASNFAAAVVVRQQSAVIQYHGLHSVVGAAAAFGFVAEKDLVGTALAMAMMVCISDRVFAESAAAEAEFALGCPDSREQLDH